MLIESKEKMKSFNKCRVAFCSKGAKSGSGHKLLTTLLYDDKMQYMIGTTSSLVESLACLGFKPPMTQLLQEVFF